MTVARHVRWFMPELLHTRLPEWDLRWRWPTRGVTVLSLTLWLLLRVLERLVGSVHWPNPPLLAHLEPCAARVLASHAGISLIWFASRRQLLAPPLP
jgi:hypothetical protein